MTQCSRDITKCDHPFSLLPEPEGYNASISVCEKNFEWQLPLHFLDLKGDMTDMMSPSAFALLVPRARLKLDGKASKP